MGEGFEDIGFVTTNSRLGKHGMRQVYARDWNGMCCLGKRGDLEGVDSRALHYVSSPRDLRFDEPARVPASCTHTSPSKSTTSTSHRGRQTAILRVGPGTCPSTWKGPNARIAFIQGYASVEQARASRGSAQAPLQGCGRRRESLLA